MDKKYLVEIVGTARKMEVNFRMPPLDLPKALTAEISDADGDGIGDKITVEYDRDITPPVRISYRWPSTAAAGKRPCGGIGRSHHRQRR